MIYDGVITKPPIEEVISHFNPNHDPKNGKFTTGSGGGFKKAIQGIRRKSRRYKKDLEDYKIDVWRRTDNRVGQANSTKWANESRDKEEKLAQKEYADWYRQDADRNQKRINAFNNKYGEHRLEDVFSKKELKEMRAQEKYANDILHPEENIRRTILKDRKAISRQIARDMVRDFQKWEKDDPSSKSNFYINGKKVSKQQMQQHLEREINKKLDTINRGYNTGEWNVNINPKGEAHFTIDGLKEYSDSQPLYFNYDIQKKKINKNWGYV